MTEQLECTSELRLIKQAQNGHEDATDELISAHMRLIHMLAYRLQTSGNMHEDLVQAGCIGFMEAIRKYNPEHHTRLITYAVPWIIGEMKHTLHVHESSVPLIPLEYLDISPDCQSGIRDETHIVSRIDLQKAYEQLRDEERIVLLLRYFRGKTQKETALILSKSQGQISKVERKLLDLLRHQLA